MNLEEIVTAKVSSGHLPLDTITGGLRGIVILEGFARGGKTTLALDACAAYPRRAGWVDLERRLNPEWALKRGASDLDVRRPEYRSGAAYDYEVAELIKQYRLVVVDSLGAWAPENDGSDPSERGAFRHLDGCWAEWAFLCDRHGTTLVCTAQMRETGSCFGASHLGLGNNKPARHFAHQILMCKRTGTVKGGESGGEVTHHKHTVSVCKNTWGAQHGTYDYHVEV